MYPQREVSHAAAEEPARSRLPTLPYPPEHPVLLDPVLQAVPTSVLLAWKSCVWWDWLGEGEGREDRNGCSPDLALE